MGKNKRMGNKKMALCYIKKGDLTIIKQKDNNFNDVIDRTIKLDLRGISTVEQVMNDTSDEQFIEYITEHYKNV